MYLPKENFTAFQWFNDEDAISWPLRVANPDDASTECGHFYLVNLLDAGVSAQ